MLEEVVGHADSPLYKLFGLSFDLYTRICLKAGLISQRMHQGRTIFTPNISEWDVMITEYNLNSHLNSINATKIDGKRYYFINIGSRKKQFHSPKDQFNGRVEPPIMLPFLRRSRRILRDVLEEEARWQSTACEDLMEEEEEEAEEIEAPEIINDQTATIPSLPDFLLEKTVLDSQRTPLLKKLYNNDHATTYQLFQSRPRW